MQNSAVAKPPEIPKSPDRKPAVAHDFSLEPLPVPDATESNTDTAWGLWEHTLKAHEELTQPADLKDFPETEQAALVPLLHKKP
jgi:hypothetical protein